MFNNKNMKIFPTKNEKYITIIIFSFIIGASLGLSIAFENQTQKDILPIIATLFAAFFGASTAFLLETRSRKQEKRERQLEEANNLLYILFEKLSIIKLFQIDFVDPIRDNPAKMIAMEPVANFHVPESEITAEKISFLFQTTYKKLMFDIHIANEKFHSVTKAIRIRSDFHLNQFQPLLEKSGHQSGDIITDQTVLDAIGERNFDMLKQYTDVVIGDVDNFVLYGDKLRADLITAFSNIFSKNEIFSFELLDKPVKIQKHSFR